MMELEKMQRAKMYIDKLANGIDPITDTNLSSDSALNNIRLSRCLFYVSDVLRQVIDNGGVVKPQKRPKRTAFALSETERQAFGFSKDPIPISTFVLQLNALIHTETVKKLTTTAITGWLLEKGFLELVDLPDGKTRKQPTELGESIGLTTELRSNYRGEYRIILYSEEAQHFVLDNLDAILAAYRNKNVVSMDPISGDR